jgi:hypothetical protein
MAGTATLNYEELPNVLGAIAARTAVDTNFRAMALSDSRAAITEACGRSLPIGISVHFVERYRSTVRTVVLPDPIEDRDLLLEEDLTGTDPWPPTSCIISCDTGSGCC